MQTFLSVWIWFCINLEWGVIGGDIECGRGDFLSCEKSTRHL